MFKKIGPGVLVAAAFIGPGTVTVCTLAGVNFGYSLLWAMLLSIVATIVLQEMAARLGIITQKGLADVIKEELPTKWIRNFVIGIILAAIVIGNASYEAGNIGGATLGMDALFGTVYNAYYPSCIGLAAFLLLISGSYKVLEKVLVGLVMLMSISFLLTAIITKPNVLEVVKGLMVPSTPSESIFTVIALVGTTVVPYNLFLHASLVHEKWKTKDELATARWDTILAIVLGGIVSMAIIITAAQLSNTQITSGLDLAKSLEPLYGSSAKYFLGIGLFAAGITSAVTAPLAAAFVANSCFGWNAGLKDWRFRAVWIGILVLGVLFLSFKIKPIEIIKFAQIANGILLPFVAVFLVWIVNKQSVMGKYRNTKFQNIAGILIVAVTLLLGGRSILKVLGIF